MSKSRRHHYVWKHYLEAWAVDGRVSVLRKHENSTYSTDPVNAAVIRDFYRLPLITEDDELLLRKFIDDLPCDEHLRRLNRGWLEPFAALSRTRRLVASDEGLASQYQDTLDQIEVNTEERFHQRIENDAIPLISKLRNQDLGFWHEQQGALQFSFFISLQHLRTKKMRDTISASVASAIPPIIFLRIWPIIRLIFSTNLGFSIYADRYNWTPKLVYANRDGNFITGDQPTINLLTSMNHNDLAIYYPVTPSLAFLLEHADNEPIYEHGAILNKIEVDKLNSLVCDKSHEQIFGTSESELKNIYRSAAPAGIEGISEHFV